MGIKAKIKKIKKMKYKKEEKKQIELEEEESSCNVITNIVQNIHRPPYHVILDTNFINDCIRKKLEPTEVLMEALNANVILYVTECVYGELEKLGRVYRLALNMIKRVKHTRLICDHKGTYADNCIIDRVRMNSVYFVATSDVNLKQRIKKIAGTPVLMMKGRKLYSENYHTLS